MTDAELIKLSKSVVSGFHLPGTWNPSRREEWREEARSVAVIAILEDARTGAPSKQITRKRAWRAVKAFLDKETGNNQTPGRGEQCPACENDGEYCRWCGAGEAQQQYISDARYEAGEADEWMSEQGAGGLLHFTHALHAGAPVSGPDGPAGIEALDWWDATKGGLSDDCYNACALVFGLDGYDELGYSDAAARLGVDETTVRRRVGRAGGERGEG